MNEGLFTNAHGLRLIQEFEGKPRLTARLCEGGKFELSYGVTFDLNGNPFTADSTCTEAEADALFRNALKLFEDGVRELVTVPLNANQFGALVAFSYNIGLANFASSTVLRRVNENRMDDAAAAFGMWIFATKNDRKQAYRGLLRRRYAEACLLLSYDWEDAVADDAISLRADPPATLPGTDAVRQKTPFAEVLFVAQRHPLPELTLTPSMKAEPATSVPHVPVAGKGSAVAVPPTPATASSSSSPGSPVRQAPVAPSAPASTAPAKLPPAGQAGGVIVYRDPKLEGGSGATAPDTKPPPPPVVLPPSVQVNTQNDMGTTAKSMYRSKRFWGGILIIAGRLIIVADVGGNFAPAIRGFIGDGVLMDWMTGVIVTMIGELILDRGEKKAEGPIDTPKRIALMTPAP